MTVRDLQDYLDQQDADVLDNAAEVLRRRYGPLTAGDLISALENRAEAIRSGES